MWLHLYLYIYIIFAFVDATESMQSQSNQITSQLLPNEPVMPVPLYELVYDQICWAICECGICLCCII